MNHLSQDQLTALAADACLLLDAEHVGVLLDVLVAHAGGWDNLRSLHQEHQEGCKES